MIVAIITGLIVGLIGLGLAYLVYYVTCKICERITLNNTYFHKIRVVSPDGGIIPTQVYLDGRKLDGVMSVDYHISTEEIPTVIIEMYGKEIDVNGVVDVHSK